MTMSDRIIVMKDGKIQQFATPGEVYSNPANEFVAHFIGTPSMNFFDCEIVKHEDTVVADIGFHEIALDPTRVDVTVTPGTTARFGVRPEHLDLREDGATGAEATVKFVEPTGKDKIVHLDVSGHAVKAIIAGDRDINDDETQRVVFEPDSVHLFDSETGTRLY